MALANHLVEDLLQTAEFLIEGARRSRGNLAKTYRRRAISAAYYAAFHAVSYILTNALVGWSKPADLVEPMFRSLDHKVAKSRLLNAADPQVRDIGVIFAELQEARNDADYRPPAYNPGQEEARDAIEQARNAVARIEALTEDARLRLAVSIIAKSR